MKRNPLKKEIEAIYSVTCGEIMAATPEAQLAHMRKLLDLWEANYYTLAQLDAEADQRAFTRGYVDEPGPIDNFYSRQSSTNRTEKP